MVGLLIFLGLLGTFWGLLQTIGSVGAVIGNLEVTAQDVDVMFAQLKAGLAGPLSGMGTAFSSSLFGLGGSLVLGFLDILAGQAQNRFFNALEEWLSGVTQFIDDDAGEDRHPVPLAVGPAPAEMEALAEELRATREMLGQALSRRPSGD